MGLFDVKRCNVEDLEADCIIISKIDDSKLDAEAGLIRNLQINFFDEQFRYNDPNGKLYVNISMVIDDGTFNYSFIERYKEALYDSVSFLLGYFEDCNVKKIALPIISFPQEIFEDIDDSIEFTLEQGLNCMLSRNENPLEVEFYTTDENLDLDKVNARVKDWVCNYILSRYEKVEEPEVSSPENNDTKLISEKPDYDAKLSIDDFINRYLGKSFDEFINEYINQENIKSSMLYKGAQISKQDFHKMITKPSLPKKQEKQKYDTVALLLGCKPDIDKFNEILSSRGFSLSDCRSKDLIIKYFILNKNFNINDINAELVKRNLEPVGNCIE